MFENLKIFNFRQFEFEFLPDGRDVGKQVVVEKVLVSIGSLDSKFCLELEMTLHDPTSCELEDEIETEFFFRKGPKFETSDVTDGMSDLDLDISGSGHSFSKVEIEPRSPNLKMELKYKGEFLIIFVFMSFVKKMLGGG